jgi:hypothetical protein
VSARMCSKCGVDQPEASFAVRSDRPSGRKSWCKTCDAEKARRYYAKNRDRVIARVAKRSRRAAEGRRPAKDSSLLAWSYSSLP